MKLWRSLLPKVNLRVNVEKRLEDWFIRRSYPTASIGRLVRDAITEFLSLVAEDIQDGKTGWPVDTGYSRDNFYASGRNLYNHASYVNYVERRGNPIASYIRRSFDSIMRRVARLIGLPPPSRFREERPRRRRPRITLGRLLQFRSIRRRDG